MHKLMEYICGELEELERKADKDGKLSMAEIQYGDTLAHMKKNLLKADEMWEDGEYSMAGGSYTTYPYDGGRSMRGGSYARRGRTGGRRGGANQYGSYATDGYSRAEDFRAELEGLIEDAPNEQVKRKMRELMRDM